MGFYKGQRNRASSIITDTFHYVNNPKTMTTDQKDAMLVNILDDVHTQIMYLTEEGRLDDALALYQEWEEHFNDNITEVEIVTINDLTSTI